MIAQWLDNHKYCHFIYCMSMSNEKTFKCNWLYIHIRDTVIGPGIQVISIAVIVKTIFKNTTSIQLFTGPSI